MNSRAKGCRRSVKRRLRSWSRFPFRNCVLSPNVAPTGE